MVCCVLALALISLMSSLCSFVRFEPSFEELFEVESLPALPIPQEGLSHSSGVSSNEVLIRSEKIKDRIIKHGQFLSVQGKEWYSCRVVSHPPMYKLPLRKSLESNGHRKQRHCWSPMHRYKRQILEKYIHTSSKSLRKRDDGRKPCTGCSLVVTPQTSFSTYVVESCATTTRIECANIFVVSVLSAE